MVKIFAFSSSNGGGDDGVGMLEQEALMNRSSLSSGLESMLNQLVSNFCFVSENRYLYPLYKRHISFKGNDFLTDAYREVFHRLRWMHVIR